MKVRIEVILNKWSVIKINYVLSSNKKRENFENVKYTKIIFLAFYLEYCYVSIRLRKLL